MIRSASRPKVLIFRNEVLPTSETFILAQTKALRSFEPVFAGVHAAPHSLALDVPPTLVAPAPTIFGKVMRRVYWRTSVAPSFYRRLRSIAPDLVHAHFAVDGAAALPICARLGVPLIVTLHGYDVTSSEEFLRRSNEGRLYLRRREELWARASVFLCISEFMRNKALEQGFPADKLCLHYTGTDLNLFHSQPQPRDPNLILFVGRLVEKKGCAHLLDALAGVRAQHPAVRLVVIGTGPLESALRQRVATEGLPCEFLGMQAAPVVRDYMARARVFCVPSVAAANGDSEGLGMVFAEAQAMGTPVASFRHGGIPEVVRHGINGLLAPEGESEALASNLLQLLQDDALWMAHSQAGLAWVHERFDIAKQTVELEGVYTQVLADRV